MNSWRLTLILRGGLCGIGLLCLTGIAETQPIEAYRYDYLQKFIVSNQLMFSGDTSKFSFLYSYDPDQLQNQSDDINPVILRPRDNGWWARPSYEVAQPFGNSFSELNQGELVAIDRKLEGVEFQDIFVFENPGRDAQ